MKKEQDKIFRRPTQLGETPKKKKDEHARKRNIIINFRVSPKEKELIEQRIAISGMSKAEFFIQSCMHQKILVRGNIRTFDEMKKKIESLAEYFKNNKDGKDLLAGLSLEQMESLRMILELLQAVYKNK